MNERIRELAEQAWDYAEENSREPYVDVYDTCLEKFAELIVGECMKVIETNHPEFDCKESADNLIRRAGRMDAIDEIKQYFEVEL